MKKHKHHVLIAASLFITSSALPAATLSYTATGGGTLTRSSIVNLDVTTPSGLIFTDFQHQTRGDGVVRDFQLFYRAGQYDELINVGTPDDPELRPAHRVGSAWTQISTIEGVSNSSTSMTSFPLTLNDAAGGVLALDQGLYSFMFHGFASAGETGSNNGVRTVGIQDSSGTLLDSDANLRIISQVSKGGSAFGTSTPNERVPGAISITYIPEPSTALLAGLGMLMCFRRSRRRVA